jgi:Zn-dependent peptidase ImmA (M78 family)
MNAVERWCNEVAAELLVPMAEFRNRFDLTGDLRSQLQPLAEYFRVSTQVILGRVREAGAVTWHEYLVELERERVRVAALMIERESGGNYYNTKPVQIGKRFARALVGSALEGRTSYTEAFVCLG